MPKHFFPKSVCILNAKSKDVAPFGKVTRSPLGLNTTISFENRFNLNSSKKSIALASGCSSNSLMPFIQIFILSSFLIDLLSFLYIQCAANPFSAISSILLLLICTSTQCPSGPITVVCKDSYPFTFGVEIQSLNLSGLGL